MRHLFLTVTLIAGTSIAGNVIASDPPRIREQPAGNRPDVTAVQLASLSADKAWPLELTDTVAIVNGRPILFSAVVGPCLRQMERAHEELLPSEYRQVQERFLRQQLRPHVEQAMMCAALREQLTPERRQRLSDEIDQQFERQLEEMQKHLEQQRMHPTTRGDLEAQIQLEGLTIPQLRSLYGEKATAQEFMREKLEGSEAVSREEMLTAYRERILEFTDPPRLKWQQIRISYKNSPDKTEAVAKAEAAAAELRQGKSFDDVAKKYSDGPGAEYGGHWDWTQYESLLDELREPLKTLPPLTPSPLLETPESIQIVQVIGRRLEHVRPFFEVQSRLHDDLVKFKHDIRVCEVLDELRASSGVQTILDDSKVSDRVGPPLPEQSNASGSAFLEPRSKAASHND